MTCHWEARTLEFQEAGKAVKLQGISSSLHTVPPMSAKSLVKSYQCNDIWALVVVSPTMSENSASPPAEVAQLLQKYQDVFADPKSLPPNRVHDHTTPLLPGAVPVNAKPYRYSPQHKD